MIPKRLDLLGLLVFTALAIVTAHIDPMGISRVIFGLIFVLILPGYSLTATLIPDPMFPMIERFLMTVGLSLSLLIPCGILLNLLPAGLTTNTWLTALSIFIIVMTILAGLRRHRRHVQSLEAVVSEPIVFRPMPLPLLSLGLTIFLIVAAAVLARVSTDQQPRPGFTQFWMLTDASDSMKIHVGLKNIEKRNTVYRIEIRVNHVVVQTWTDISLTNDAQWETSLNLAQPQSIERVEAFLYRLDQPNQIYRQTLLWVGNVAEF